MCKIYTKVDVSHTKYWSRTCMFNTWHLAVNFSMTNLGPDLFFMFTLLGRDLRGQKKCILHICETATNYDSIKILQIMCHTFILLYILLRFHLKTKTKTIFLVTLLNKFSICVVLHCMVLVF